ncbi:MAG: DUF6580 family putative transport protein [Leptonema sp. (in: bacteria)]
MAKNNYKEIFYIVLLIIVGVLSRLVEHLPNFTPLVGLSLFLSYRWNPKYSIAFVLTTMIVSDLIIGFESIQMRLLVYGSLFLPSILGFFIKKYKKIYNKYITIFAFSFASSTFFYLTTNFGVWLWSGMYEPTFESLVFCYTMALPFFKNSLLGDLFSSFFIFGSYDVLIYYKQIKGKTEEKNLRSIL